jgi:hypothetical protein
MEVVATGQGYYVGDNGAEYFLAETARGFKIQSFPRTPQGLIDAQKEWRSWNTESTQGAQ